VYWPAEIGTAAKQEKLKQEASPGYDAQLVSKD
jgi:hypothetical protein